MYIPKRYKSESDQEALDYIRKNGFATLIGHYDNRVIASHIPLFLRQTEDKIFLDGHISINNDLKYCLEERQQLLAIFMGEHAYISSSWYSHIDVPTWNYIAVHVYGTPRIQSSQELGKSLEHLVEHYEYKREPRFNISDMSDKMMEAQKNGIIGFELAIEKIETAHKLSQNKKSNDVDSIIEKLREESDEKSHKIAEAMNKNRKR